MSPFRIRVRLNLSLKEGILLMIIHGLNKTTLLDFPGHLAATVFFGGCNFRCPFCHNASLVLNPKSQPVISEEEFFSFLQKRKNILEGVCITGGEPTLMPDLEEFIRKIKDYGLPVKLDTNGYRPEVLKDLVNKKIIDYVAMDIKSSPDSYNEACGAVVDIEKIKESVNFLKEDHVPYEFRTTIVKELHGEEEVIKIGQWLSGCKQYFLQSYKDSGDIILPEFSAHDSSTLKKFQTILEKTIKHVSIRGLDVD